LLPLICVALHRYFFWVSPRPGGRVRGVSEGDMKTDSENEPRQMSWFVFRNSPLGPPTLWVPRVFLLPRILRRVRLSCPHPLEKGSGG
jgi:hypothetical protein